MYMSAYHLNKVWLGSQNIRPAIGLPTNIDEIVDELPPNSLYTAEFFILNHTLFPVYYPFLPQERQDALLKSMKGYGLLSTDTIIGRAASGIPQPDFFQSCPECVLEDEVRDDVGEPYWRRLHQSPGVLVCPQHRVWLEHSEISTKDLRLFHSATDNIQVRVVRPLNLEQVEDQILLRIAQDTEWLLVNHPITDFAELRQRYLKILADKDYATYNGNIYSSALCEAFNAYYPTEILLKLGCELEGHYKRNWLARMVKSEQVHHPLRHLLLIQFLGLSIEEFFSYPLEIQPFGVGPWPCLNPTCDLYTKPVVEDCCVGFSRYQGRAPVGTFICQCGFTYTRKGPDKTPEDRFRIGKIRAYGPVWDAKLKDLWFNSELNFKEISIALGCGIDRLRAQAKRLRLPSRGRYIAPASEMSPHRSTYGDIPTKEMIEQYRNEWLAAVKAHPDLGTKELEKLFPKLHRWLDRHDRQWLNSNKPDGRFCLHASKVDWLARDNELVRRAAEVVSAILANSTAPIRITSESISRAMGFSRGFKKRDLQKMPQLQRFIVNSAETPQQFAARRCALSDLVRAK